MLLLRTQYLCVCIYIYIFFPYNFLTTSFIFLFILLLFVTLRRSSISLFSLCHGRFFFRDGREIKFVRSWHPDNQSACPRPLARLTFIFCHWFKAFFFNDVLFIYLFVFVFFGDGVLIVFQVKTGMTMTEKILARASEKTQLRPGENVWVNVDVLMTHDICGAPTFEIFKKEFGQDAKVLWSI